MKTFLILISITFLSVGSLAFGDCAGYKHDSQKVADGSDQMSTLKGYEVVQKADEEEDLIIPKVAFAEVGESEVPLIDEPEAK